MTSSGAVDGVIGAQWGDEGKGSVVHLLSVEGGYNFAFRYQGGANAGHTLEDGTNVYKFHLMPSGIVGRSGLVSFLTDGVALDPVILAEEIINLSKLGINLDGRLVVGRGASLVLGFHKMQDAYMEEFHNGKGTAIGTTLRGIGPGYADRFFRVDLKAGDLLASDFRAKVQTALERKNTLFRGFYGKEAMGFVQLWEPLAAARDIVAPHVGDAVETIRKQLAEGAYGLAEGAQGFGLDIDYGERKFVTSSSCGPAGIIKGSGVNWRHLRRIIGVAKAYCTRVGNGSFPTEGTPEESAYLREKGHEKGTTTGRDRRCGWLDLVQLKRAVELYGLTELALTKADVLDGLTEVKVCVAYEQSTCELSEAKPVYEKLSGWPESSTRPCRAKGELPDAFCQFVGMIEEHVGIPVTILSVGPDLRQKIYIKQAEAA